VRKTQRIPFSTVLRFGPRPTSTVGPPLRGQQRLELLPLGVSEVRYQRAGYRERSPDLVIAGPILSSSLLGQRSFGRLSSRNHCSRAAAKLIF
jgi:hypothetical protein